MFTSLRPPSPNSLFLGILAIFMVASSGRVWQSVYPKRISALFVFSVFAIVLISCCGIQMLLNTKEVKLKSAAIVYLNYFLVHGLFIRQNFNSYHAYIVISCTTVLVLSLFINDRMTEIIYLGIFFLAVIESLICLLQYVDVVEALSANFRVIGTVSSY